MMSLAIRLMAMMLLLLVLVQQTKADASKGFNSQIDWIQGGLEAVRFVCFKQGLVTDHQIQAKEKAKEQGKPIVALVHKTWCGACKALKKDFASGGEGVNRVIQASKNYVMVNLEDGESDGLKELEPEGAGYIPRVVFFDPEGKPRPEIKSKANPQYAYFYPNAASLADMMEHSASTVFKKSEL